MLSMISVLISKKGRLLAWLVNQDAANLQPEELCFGCLILRKAKFYLMEKMS
jgi:hypothetical protein